MRPAPPFVVQRCPSPSSSTVWERCCVSHWKGRRCAADTWPTAPSERRALRALDQQAISSMLGSPHRCSLGPCQERSMRRSRRTRRTTRGSPCDGDCMTSQAGKHSRAHGHQPLHSPANSPVPAHRSVVTPRAQQAPSLVPQHPRVCGHATRSEVVGCGSGTV